MVKLESVEEVKREALNFLARMGETAWASEIQKIKKSNSVWEVQLKKSFPNETFNLEIDADTGKVLSYEKIK